MTIACVNADENVPVFGTGGPSVHVQEVLRAMLRRGDDVHLFATRFGGPITAEFTGMHVHDLPPPAKGDLAARERAALALNAPLRSELDAQFRTDRISIVYERYSLWSFAGMEYAQEQGIPGVLEVNAPLLEESASQRTLIDRAAAEQVTMRAFRAASAIVVVSKQLAGLVERHPSAYGKVHVVPNGVNVERFATARAATAKSDEEFVVGFVGSLKPSQGLTVLVNAFELLADALPMARLLIVGDGPEREHLHREIASRELLERVKFTNAVSPHEVPNLLASMDAAVAPYPALVNFYFSPLKLYEYMAAGLPIVASSIGQVAEVIQNNVNGLLVPPGDAEAVAQSLFDLASNPDLRRDLGMAAKQSAAIRHTWDSVVNQIVSLAESSVDTRIIYRTHC